MAENLLNQKFDTTRPNEAWVTDITYVRTGEGWLYLAGVKDIHTCELVGHALGHRMTTELVATALVKANTAKRPAPGLIHHSDRGSQYCARDYRQLLERFGMKASMSRRGNCYDNAPMKASGARSRTNSCTTGVTKPGNKQLGKSPSTSRSSTIGSGGIPDWVICHRRRLRNSITSGNTQHNAATHGVVYC